MKVEKSKNAKRKSKKGGIQEELGSWIYVIIALVVLITIIIIKFVLGTIIKGETSWRESLIEKLS